MNTMRIQAILWLLVIIGAGYFALKYMNAQSALRWADQISQETLEDGWGTWNTHYRSEIAPELDKETFFDKVQQGYYQTMSIDDFLVLDVENHRLKKYKHAITPEQVYPPDDRPRGQHDIESVTYLMNTQNEISPVFVSKIKNCNEQVRYIKLDGVHRLVAAMLKKSAVRVFFIDIEQVC